LAALPALTLLECGAGASDPAVQKAAAFVRANATKSAITSPTYECSLAILFLDRLGDAADEPLIRSLAAPRGGSVGRRRLDVWPAGAVRPGGGPAHGFPGADAAPAPEPRRLL